MPKRPTHLRVVGKEERPLTEKQEAFCQLVAKGRMLVEAYREAGYMPNGSEKTQWEAASRLMSSNSKVIARVKAIQADMEQDRRTIEARRAEWILKRLTEEADQADNASSRIRALELLGKSLTVSMFTDRVEQSDTTERSASDIERDLRAKLDRLIGS
jgi:phage terminase small subunit